MKKAVLLFLVGVVFLPIDVQYVPLNDLEKMKISVEIRGHVEHEGIYEFERGTTIGEALRLAGILENSSVEAINQTQILHHQDVLTISEMNGHLIHINTATLNELMTLPGIGEKTAQKIIDYRNEHLFQTLEELMEVSGIGEKKYEALKEMIGL